VLLILFWLRTIHGFPFSRFLHLFWYPKLGSFLLFLINIIILCPFPSPCFYLISAFFSVTGKAIGDDGSLNEYPCSEPSYNFPSQVLSFAVHPFLDELSFVPFFSLHLEASVIGDTHLWSAHFSCWIREDSHFPSMFTYLHVYILSPTALSPLILHPARWLLLTIFR